MKINERVKKQILAKLQKVLEDWSKEKWFDKPREKCAIVAQAEMGGYHSAFCLMIGDDRLEISQMVDEIALLHDKFMADIKDRKTFEDFKRRRY